MLAAAGAALLASTALPAPPRQHRAEPEPVRPHPDAVRSADPLAPTAPADPPPQFPPEPEAVSPRAVAVRAADLLARARACTPVSRGRYRSDLGKPADIKVCGTRDTVHWKADLDIDCDGRPGPRCNARTDPLFSSSTAYAQSDGRPPSAERLPYVVVPGPSRVWDHREHGVGGGSVVAVVHHDRVRYGVVADIGPRGVIGEASHAMARDLGILPDPHGGGADADVTYIAFKGSRVTALEDHAEAVRTGERLARRFLRGG
jgi:hypothetical protein